MKNTPGQETLSDRSEAVDSRSPVDEATSSVQSATRKVLRRRRKVRTLTKEDVAPERKKLKRRRKVRKLTAEDVLPSPKELEAVTRNIHRWLQSKPIDLDTTHSPDDLKSAYEERHPEDQRIIERSLGHFDPLFSAALKKAQEANKAKEQQAKKDIAREIEKLLTSEDVENADLSKLETFKAAMLSRPRLQSILMKHQKPESLYTELEAHAKTLIDNLHSVWKKKHEELKAAEKKDLETRVQSFLDKPIDLQKVKSPDGLKQLYLQQHSQDRKLLEEHSDHFDTLFAEAYSAAEKEEEEEGDALEKSMTAWIAQQKIDLTKVQSKEDLVKLYLEKHPQEKEQYNADKQRFDPLFAVAYKKALDAYEAKRKQAKAGIATVTNTLLVDKDIENESFKTKTLFVTAMLSRPRLQSIFMKNAKPDGLHNELETYAKILIEKLHAVWKKKHEALKDTTMAEELSQIESAIGSWKPPAHTQYASFDEFWTTFFQACTCKEIINKHKGFSQSALKLKWAAQDFTQKQTPETQLLENTSDQSVAAIALASDSTHAQAIRLSPELLQAPSGTGNEILESILNESIHNRFAVNWGSPAVVLSFLHQNRLQVGGERFRRLVQSQKVDELFSGREDNLVPFFLSVCGELRNENEIQRCIQEFELSDSPKDTVKIFLASDECRRAAFRVRDKPQIWTGLVNALASIGVTLKDLHLHMEDEDQSELEISTEMVQEVIEAREEPEEEHGDSDISLIESEEELGWEENDIYGQPDVEERVEIEEPAYTEQFAFSRRFARNNLTEAGAYKKAQMTT